MNCQETLNLLYDVIDKEASEIDVLEVQKHLDHCQDCLKKFQIQESLQLLVKERLKAVSDIPKIDHLKSKVLAKLEEAEASLPKSSRQPVPFRLPAIALALAAAVILLVGAAFWGVGLYDHYVEYIPLERAHWEAAADISGFQNQSTTASVLANVTSTYGLTLANSQDGLSLIGARTEDVKGMTVTHALYSGDGRMVSTFVFPAEAVAIPDDLLETRIEINGVCHFVHNCRGCYLVYHKQGSAMIITATTDHEFPLPEFAPVFATGAI
jgi:hypothetical protein